MLDRDSDAGLRVQPMLAALSLCLLGLAVGLDVLGLAAALPLSTELATWDIAAALTTGLLGGAAAVLDLRWIRSSTGAFRSALAQLFLQGGALGLLSLSLILRTLGPLPSLPSIILAALGLAFLLVARWLCSASWTWPTAPRSGMRRPDDERSPKGASPPNPRLGRSARV